MLPGIVVTSDKFQRYSSSMDHLTVVISAFCRNSNVLLLDWRILKFRKKKCIYSKMKTMVNNVILVPLINTENLTRVTQA